MIDAREIIDATLRDRRQMISIAARPSIGGCEPLQPRGEWISNLKLDLSIASIHTGYSTVRPHAETLELDRQSTHQLSINMPLGTLNTTDK